MESSCQNETEWRYHQLGRGENSLCSCDANRFYWRDNLHEQHQQLGQVGDC
jgi:hypothetical protein